MKTITLYCDGSSLGNPGYGGWCAILCYQDSRKIISGGEANTTNNRMELKAVLEGLKALKEPCEVAIISDSKYVCDSINLWLKNWIIKNFREIKNPDLWREYVSLSTKHIIKAAWVKGHSGHAENEECDKIAKAEAQKIKDADLEAQKNGESTANRAGKLFDLRTNAKRQTKLQFSRESSTKSLRESNNTHTITPSARDEKSVDCHESTHKSKPKSKKIAEEKQKATKLSKKITDAISAKNGNGIFTLQTRIGYFFKDENLLLLALTHKSFDKNTNNERLEFLGDAVLDLIIGEFVFVKLPKCNEGILTKIRAAMVNENSFANLANNIELGKYIFISKSESRNAGHKKPSILSDAFEALIGAIYLDSGLESAKKVALSLIEREYKDIELTSLFVDYKTALQELTQAICGALPEYVLLDSSGPDHNKNFTMQVFINSQEFATANGKSKKEAEQLCAKIAFKRIKREQDTQVGQ